MELLSASIKLQKAELELFNPKTELQKTAHELLKAPVELLKAPTGLPGTAIKKLIGGKKGVRPVEPLPSFVCNSFFSVKK